jgi:hypothetical protein
LEDAVAARADRSRTSTLMMRPVPGTSSTISWSEVQVQAAPFSSNSISRVKSARVGSGKTVNVSLSGRKRISESEFEPVIHTSPVRLLTPTSYGSSWPRGSVGSG